MVYFRYYLIYFLVVSFPQLLRIVVTAPCCTSVPMLYYNTKNMLPAFVSSLPLNICNFTSALSSLSHNSSRKEHYGTKITMAVRLGPNSSNALYCSEVAVGTIAWGDDTRGYGESFLRRDIDGSVSYLLENGVNLFDTAEVYGYKSMEKGESAEQLLGDALVSAKGGTLALVADKFFPVLWSNVIMGGSLRMGRAAVLEALRASLTRLGLSQIDLYQIHFPFPYIGGEKAIVDGFCEAYELGLVKAVGVSNYNDPKSLRRK